MKSELAKAEIERLESEGLKPTFDDIVRLNGLALRLEYAKCDNIYALPRVAYLGGVTFREPSIAQSVWIDEVAEYSADDYASRLAITAYALAHAPWELPPSVKRRECVKAVKNFSRKDLGYFTIRQIDAAVVYCLHGADPAALEQVSARSGAPGALECAESIGCGVLIETAALALGVSLKELSEMTIARVLALRYRALKARKEEPYKELSAKLKKDFFIALDEIEARLKAEKEAEDGGREDNV